MSEQINKIVQVNDPILNNLVNTENKLNELNQEVGVILEEYQTVNKTESSFFNFGNPFFILTLLGLFILALSLWFLGQELKYKQPKKKSKSIIKEKLNVRVAPKITKDSNLSTLNSRPKEQGKEKSKLVLDKKSSHNKARKIKVVKIK